MRIPRRLPDALERVQAFPVEPRPSRVPNDQIQPSRVPNDQIQPSRVPNDQIQPRRLPDARCRALRPPHTPPPASLLVCPTPRQRSAGRARARRANSQSRAGPLSRRSRRALGPTPPKSRGHTAGEAGKAGGRWRRGRASFLERTLGARSPECPLPAGDAGRAEGLACLHRVPGICACPACIYIPVHTPTMPAYPQASAHFPRASCCTPLHTRAYPQRGIRVNYLFTRPPRQGRPGSCAVSTPLRAVSPVCAQSRQSARSLASLRAWSAVAHRAPAS